MSNPKIPKLLQKWKLIPFQCPMKFVALKKANKVKVVHNITHDNVPHRVPSPDLEQRRGYECSLSVSWTPRQVASSRARAAQQFRFLRFKHCFRQWWSIKHTIVTCTYFRKYIRWASNSISVHCRFCAIFSTNVGQFYGANYWPVHAEEGATVPSHTYFSQRPACTLKGLNLFQFAITKV